MGDGFIGEIRLFSGLFVPKCWLLCNGALRSLALDFDSFLPQLLGTRFGGDGQTTYALPNLADPAPGLRYIICIYGMYPAQPDGDLAGPPGYLAEVRLFAGLYSPQNWLHCDGSLLPVNQNLALVSLIRNKFGGDGIHTFALPRMADLAPGVKYITCVGGCYPYPA